MAINRTPPNTKTALDVEVEKPVVGDQAARGKTPTKTTPRRPAPPAVEAGPRYLEMQRVDGRIRPDQSEDLAALRRRILRGRADRSERITDNTLLRVAVDLLLARVPELVGDTEDEMAASLLTEQQMKERNARRNR